MTKSSQQVINEVSNGIKVLGGIASAEEKIYPYAMMIAGLFPGPASVLAAISLAQPYIQKVADYAPQIANAIQGGASVLDAIRAEAPQVMQHLKAVYTTLSSVDPALSHISTDEVLDSIAAEIFKTLFLNNQFSPQDPRFDRASTEA